MKKLVSVIFAIILLATITAFADEVTLVDNTSVTIRVKSYEVDKLWGTTMQVYLENKTNKKV